MYDFNYHRPKDVKQAVKILRDSDDGVPMSGGMTLIPTMKQRLAAPSDVVDVASVTGSGIRASAGKVTIKAGTTHAAVASHAGIQKHCPSLAALAGMIGDPHVRNKGTIGGSIANNDPAADYPAACLALAAKIVTNKRTIDADKFFKGLFETALRDNEIITEVEFACPKRGSYAKFPNPASRYAMVGVYVADHGRKGIRVAVTGATDSAHRNKAMEKALTEDFSAGALDGVKVKSDDMNDDIHGSADYRAHLVTVMAKRAVAASG
ncbi:MAG: xanthine dehydrogenase family protein subunit M [Pseudomonadota bacterium]